MASRVLAIAAAVLCFGQVFLDARADAPGRWDGPYVGLYAGYSFAPAEATAPYDSNTGFFYNWTGSRYSIDAHGALAGATAGYNWQRDDWVAGLEADIGYLGLSGSAIEPNFQPGTAHIPDTKTRIDSDFHAALSVRGGKAVGSALFYVKAGGTLLNARASTIDPCMNAAGCGTTTLTMHGSKVMLGWTAGGGAEWRIGPRWTAKLDYAYFDFGSIETSGPSSTAGEFYRQRIDVAAHAVKLGLNYRLAMPGR